MIRTLRKKFIGIAMLSLLGTMAVLCATIGIGNYYVAASRADKAIDILYQMAANSRCRTAMQVPPPTQAFRSRRKRRLRPAISLCA